jgi:ABC-type branched-subunit amino acid transport system substrate-binding protein
MSHLSTLGIKRVAVVYQDIPFGQGGMKFIDEIAPSLSVSVVGRVPVPSAADNLSSQAALLRASNAQAYVMILAPNSGTSLARDVRVGKDTTPIYGMSYVPVKGIIDKTSGTNAAGIGLAQVTPNTFSASSGLVRRFRAVMAKHTPAVKEHTQLHLIGYISCRALVEESLQASLRKVRIDLGGYMVDFAGTNVASKFVDIGVITNDGRLMY